MSRFQHSLKALEQARHQIAVGRSKGELTKIADLVDSFLDTPQMEACIARFRALPEGAALMEAGVLSIHRSSRSSGSHSKRSQPMLPELLCGRVP
jgi:hypothetical protein